MYGTTVVKDSRTAESVISADILETQKSVFADVMSGYWTLIKVQSNLSTTVNLRTEEGGLGT